MGRFGGLPEAIFFTRFPSSSALVGLELHYTILTSLQLYYSGRLKALIW